jgi:hypothetical protein
MAKCVRCALGTCNTHTHTGRLSDGPPEMSQRSTGLAYNTQMSIPPHDPARCVRCMIGMCTDPAGIRQISTGRPAISHVTTCPPETSQISTTAPETARCARCMIGMCTDPTHAACVGYAPGISIDRQERSQTSTGPPDTSQKSTGTHVPSQCVRCALGICCAPTNTGEVSNGSPDTSRISIGQPETLRCVRCALGICADPTHPPPKANISVAQLKCARCGSATCSDPQHRLTEQEKSQDHRPVEHCHSCVIGICDDPSHTTQPPSGETGMPPAHENPDFRDTCYSCLLGICRDPCHRALDSPASPEDETPVYYEVRKEDCSRCSFGVCQDPSHQSHQSKFTPEVRCPEISTQKTSPEVETPVYHEVRKEACSRCAFGVCQDPSHHPHQPMFTPEVRCPEVSIEKTLPPLTTSRRTSLAPHHYRHGIFQPHRALSTTARQREISRRPFQ